jgi:hypothetical protein
MDEDEVKDQSVTLIEAPFPLPSSFAPVAKLSFDHFPLSLLKVNMFGGSVSADDIAALRRSLHIRMPEKLFRFRWRMDLIVASWTRVASCHVVDSLPPHPMRSIR